MIHPITDEEIKRWDERVEELRTSTDKVDNIQAILMDSCCGNTGIPESQARIKATAIYTLMREWQRDDK